MDRRGERAITGGGEDGGRGEKSSDEVNVVVVEDRTTNKALTQVFPTTSTSTIQRPWRNPPVAGLDVRTHTNRISLIVFLLHLLFIIAAVCFFSLKTIHGILNDEVEVRRHVYFWIPPIEGTVLLAILLAFMWQKTIREWPGFMVKFILWFCFGSTMAAGVLLVFFSKPATSGLGAALIIFSIGTGLYACWVMKRVHFAGDVLKKSFRPATRFPDLNHPTYGMLFLGFVWISVWCFAVIGALKFYYPPVTVLMMVLSLMWTAEVMRNVTNLTVSRVIALYYLRGIESNTWFSFVRIMSKNLGSACLGSLFAPMIEASRIVARGLNLLEGEDEFMFSCAHCCLRVMEAIFNYSNSWAFVHIAAYGKGFVTSSKDAWDLFERSGMVALVDADMTRSLCFLSGVSSGSVCAIFAASWTFSTRREYTATVSLLALFVGYLMTRIGMALPHACVGCYYICYAENPSNQLFDSTIPNRINDIISGRDIVAPVYRR